jgi:hypothetical protein
MSDTRQIPSKDRTKAPADITTTPTPRDVTSSMFAFYIVVHGEILG